MTQIDINDPAIRQAIRDRVKQRVRDRVASSMPAPAAAPVGPSVADFASHPIDLSPGSVQDVPMGPAPEIRTPEGIGIGPSLGLGIAKGTVRTGGDIARLVQSGGAFARAVPQAIGAAVMGGVGRVADVVQNPGLLVTGGVGPTSLEALHMAETPPMATPGVIEQAAGSVADTLGQRANTMQRYFTSPAAQVPYSAEWFADQIGSSIPGMAASVGGAAVGTAVGGPVGGFLGAAGPTFLQEAGSAASQIYATRKAQGASDEEALAEAFLPSMASGAVNSAVEFAGPEGQVVRKLVGKNIGGAVRQILGSAAQEGLEEAVQGTVSDIAQGGATGEVDPLGDYIDRRLQEMAVGATMGGAAGAAIRAVPSIPGRTPPQTPVRTSPTTQSPQAPVVPAVTQDIPAVNQPVPAPTQPAKEQAQQQGTGGVAGHRGDDTGIDRRAMLLRVRSVVRGYVADGRLSAEQAGEVSERVADKFAANAQVMRQEDLEAAIEQEITAGSGAVGEAHSNEARGRSGAGGQVDSADLTPADQTPTAEDARLSPAPRADEPKTSRTAIRQTSDAPSVDPLLVPGNPQLTVEYSGREGRARFAAERGISIEEVNRIAEANSKALADFLRSQKIGTRVEMGDGTYWENTTGSTWRKFRADGTAIQGEIMSPTLTSREIIGKAVTPPGAVPSVGSTSSGMTPPSVDHPTGPLAGIVEHSPATTDVGAVTLDVTTGDGGVGERPQAGDRSIVEGLHSDLHDLTSLSYADLRKRYAAQFGKPPRVGTSKAKMVELLRGASGVSLSQSGPTPEVSQTSQAESPSARPASETAASAPVDKSAGSFPDSTPQYATWSDGKIRQEARKRKLNWKGRTDDVRDRVMLDEARKGAESNGYELVQNRLMTSEEANGLTDASGDQIVMEVPGDPQGRVVLIRPKAGNSAATPDSSPVTGRNDAPRAVSEQGTPDRYVAAFGKDGDGAKFVVEDTQTGKVVSKHDTNDEAEAAANAANSPEIPDTSTVKGELTVQDAPPVKPSLTTPTPKPETPAPAVQQNEPKREEGGTGKGGLQVGEEVYFRGENGTAVSRVTEAKVMFGRQKVKLLNGTKWFDASDPRISRERPSGGSVPDSLASKKAESVKSAPSVRQGVADPTAEPQGEQAHRKSLAEHLADAEKYPASVRPTPEEAAKYHRQQVELALRNGWPTSPSLSRDYPDLSVPSPAQAEATTTPKSEITPGVKSDIAEKADDAPKWGIYRVQTSQGERFAVRQSDKTGGFGDTLHKTEADARKYAKDEQERDAANTAFREKENAARSEKDAKDAAIKAEREDLDGFTDGMPTLPKFRAVKVLNELRNIGGSITYLKSHIRRMVKAGNLTLETSEEPKIKPMSRTQFNRADQREQDAHEKKMKEAGTKTVYRVNGYDLGKIAYDYAKFLQGKNEASSISDSEMLRRLQSVEDKSNGRGYEPLSEGETAPLLQSGMVRRKDGKISLTDAGRSRFNDLRLEEKSRSARDLRESDERAELEYDRRRAELDKLPPPKVGNSLSGEDTTWNVQQVDDNPNRPGTWIVRATMQGDGSTRRTLRWPENADDYTIVESSTPDTARAKPPTETPNRKDANEDQEGRKEGREGLLKPPASDVIAPDAPKGVAGVSELPGFSVSKDDLPLKEAVAAHSGTSHTPESRGDMEQREYVRHIEGVRDYFLSLAKTPEQRAALADELNRYKAGYLQHLRAYLSARSRVMSSMITGPANFPVASNQKKGDTANRRNNELLAWSKKAQAAIKRSLFPEAAKSISSDNENAPDLLRKKIEEAEKLQEAMKQANNIVRDKSLTDEQKVAQLEEIGFEGSRGRELLKPDFAKRVGFPSYALQNNLANIKRMKDRVVEIERTSSRPTNEVTFTGGKIVDNADENRVQIIFDAKPSPDVIAQLKGAAFKWAPSQGAWQRLRTNNAVRAARMIAEKIGGVSESSAQPPSPAPDSGVQQVDSERAVGVQQPTRESFQALQARARELGVSDKGTRPVIERRIGEAEARAKAAELRKNPQKHETTDTIAGTMNLDEFESKGYTPDEVTRSEWVEMQRKLRRSLGQPEESGTAAAPFADYEEYHRDAVKRAVAAGEEVDDRVLADYPELAERATAVQQEGNGDATDKDVRGSNLIEKVVATSTATSTQAPVNTDDTNARGGRDQQATSEKKGTETSEESEQNSTENNTSLPWSGSSVEDEHRWYGTRVTVAPDIKGNDPFTGTVERVLNGGNLVEVKPDGTEDTSWRIRSERVTVDELKDSRPDRSKGPAPTTPEQRQAIFDETYEEYRKNNPDDTHGYGRLLAGLGAILERAGIKPTMKREDGSTVPMAMELSSRFHSPLASYVSRPPPVADIVRGMEIITKNASDAAATRNIRNASLSVYESDPVERIAKIKDKLSDYRTYSPGAYIRDAKADAIDLERRADIIDALAGKATEAGAKARQLAVTAREQADRAEKYLNDQLQEAEQEAAQIPTKNAESLAPLSDIKPLLSRGWAGAMADGSAVVSDGRAIVLTESLSKSDAEKLAKSPKGFEGNVKPPVSLVDEMWKEAVSSTEDARILGTIESGTDEGRSLLVEYGDDDMVSFSANRIAYLAKVSGADSLRVGRIRKLKVAVLYDGDKPVASLTALGKVPNEMDLPAVMDRTKARERAKAIGLGSSALREQASPTLSSRIETKIEEIKANRAKRQVKRGRNTGSTSLTADIVDAAAIAFLRAVQAGDLAGRALTKHVKAALATINSKADPKKTRKVVKGLIRDTNALKAKPSDEAVDRAIDTLLKQTVERPKIKKVIQANAGPGEPEKPTVTRGQAEKIKYSYASKVANDVRRNTKAEEARRFREETLPELREKWSLRTMLKSVAGQGAAFKAGEAAGWKRGRFSIAQAQAIRESLVEEVRDKLPRALHGKFTEAIRDVNTYQKLRKALDRVERETILYEGRQIAKKGQKKVKAKYLSALEPEERADINVALNAVKQARAKLSPKGQAGLSIDDLTAARDELQAALNAVKGILHESQQRDKVRIKGEIIESNAVRGEVIDSLNKREELPQSDTPGEREPAWIARVARRRTNWETLMKMIDGWRKGGPAGRLFQRVLQGRRASLKLHHEFTDKIGEIVTRHGYKSLGQFLAEVSGTLGPLGQKKIAFKLGGHDTITLGQAAYLYAASTDAGFRRRIRSGQPLKFRDERVGGEPFTITMGHIRLLEQKIPDNVKAIIDEAKKAYDAHYFNRLSAVNKRLKGYHLTKERGYWGIKLDRTETDTKGVPLSWRGQVIRAMEESGYMQERTGPGKSPILIGDFGTDILLRSKSSATVIGKAEITKLLARVFVHADTRRAMAKALGAESYDRMERRIALYSGGDLFREANERAPRKILSLWARGKTQLWLPTWVRNMVAGMPRMLHELGIKDVAKGALTPSWGAFQELRRYSDEARERWDSGGLGAFYHGGGQAESHARISDALKGSARNLFTMVGRGLTGNFKKASEAARGTGRSWESLLDSLTIGNFFDAAPAIVAYKHFQSKAPSKYTTEQKKRWAAQHAMRAFERVSNTATTEYANDVQLDARDSTLVASFVPFTGDTAKLQNMIYEAWHTGDTRTQRNLNRARVTGVVALGALMSAAVTALWSGALGDDRDKVKRGAVARLAMELSGLMPIVGIPASNLLQRKIGSDKPVTPEFDTPLTALLDSVMEIGSNVYDGFDRWVDPQERQVLTAGDKFLRAFWGSLGVAGEGAGEGAGVPVQYVRALIRAFRNWQE